MSQNAYNTQVSPLVDPTLYASPLITITKHGYTKHYFEGMNRICSKLGGGFDAGLLGEIEDTVPTLACNYVQQSKRQNEGANRTFADCLGMGAEVDGKYDLYKVVIRETERDEKEPAFYYHSDHLGSAAYLTNDDGKVTQTLNYLPYGEDWVDVRNDLDPRLGQYTFNGKEKDHESGFHYYGARYYWSELLTGWLSVDPMMDKYPGISPYNYCMWNPVKLVDPDGNEPVKPLIRYYGNGSFMVNTDNLRNVTRKQIELANFYGAHDEGSIGVNLTIGHYRTPRINPVISVPQDAVGIDPDHIITQTPPTGKLRRNGQPYYNNYQWNSCAKGPGQGKGAGIAFLAVDVLVYAANMYQMIGINKDNNELRRQTRLLNKAANMVTRAIESGDIFNESQASSNDFLGDVINYIYQGTHALNGGTVKGRPISSDAINKAKEIMARNNLDYPLISY